MRLLRKVIACFRPSDREQARQAIRQFFAGPPSIEAWRQLKELLVSCVRQGELLPASRPFADVVLVANYDCAAWDTTRKPDYIPSHIELMYALAYLAEHRPRHPARRRNRFGTSKAL